MWVHTYLLNVFGSFDRLNYFVVQQDIHTHRHCKLSCDLWQAILTLNHLIGRQISQCQAEMYTPSAALYLDNETLETHTMLSV